MGVAKSGVGLKAGLAAAGVGAALLAKEVYNVGKEFDDAYDKIRVGTGKTGKQLDRLKDDFKNVVSSVPTNFEDAADAVAELNARLNQSGKPLRERAKQFLELSRITDTDVTENIKSVTRAFGDWEVAAGKQGKQLDKFFRASQGSGASVAELAENVVKFGAPLRQIGMSLDEATAMFAAFEKAGVNTSTMLPGLKMAMKVALQEDKDPARFIKAAFKGIEDGSIKSSRALELFGTRAGGDMIEAVQQGRFHLEEFTKSLATGNETIRKAGQETMDTSENLQLLGNKIKVLVAPAAEWLYDAVGKLSKAFATMNFKPLLRDLGLTDREIKNLGEAFRRVMDFIGPLVKSTIDGIAQYLKGFVGVVKGVVRVISAVLSGDFKEAWEGVKDIFSNYGKAILGLLKALTAPMRGAAKLVGGAIGDGFDSAWSRITGIFKAGANAAIGVLNSMIRVFNGIPFIPDIGEVGVIGGAGGNGTGRDVNGKSIGRQRGGKMLGGAPSGDSIPAMLERGEYVLNRNAVKAIGTRTLDAVNFGAAPRFQEGGPVRLISGGDVWGAVKDVAGYTPPGLAFKGAKAAFGWAKGFPAVAGAIGDITGMASRFPGWMDPSWFINAAIDWLRGKTQAQAKERAARSYSAAYKGPPASMKQLGDNAWVDSHTLAVAAFLEKKFGVSRSSGYRDPAYNASVGGVPGSLHTHGSSGNPGAIDFVPANSSLQAWVGQHIAGIQENLIHDVGSGLHNHIGFFQRGGLAGKKGPWAGTSIDRSYPPSDGYSGAKLPRYVIESLAEWAGLPGKTMYQITQGESMGHPGVDISDPPGRSRGLYAINDHYNPQYSAADMRNPILNTLAAAEIAGAAGGPNSNIWHGSGHVTGWNLHSTAKAPAAIARHLGGKLKAKAKGGGKHAKPKFTGSAGGIAAPAGSNKPGRNEFGLSSAFAAPPYGRTRGVTRDLVGPEPVAAGEAGEDPLLAAMEADREAREAHTEAIKENTEAMKRQTQFAESAVATSAVSGMKAVADILNGMLGGSAQQSAALAGAGSIGSIGRT